MHYDNGIQSLKCMNLFKLKYVEQSIGLVNPRIVRIVRIAEFAANLTIRVNLINLVNQTHDPSVRPKTEVLCKPT